jgi:16S rRNA (cytosine1402-N4)-methyltransferase
MSEPDRNRPSTDPPHDPPGHYPVLAEQVLGLLDPQPGECFMDLTIGRAGHARLVAERIGGQGRIIGLDLDPDNLDFAGQRLAGFDLRLDLFHRSFDEARRVLDELGLGGVDLVLGDLGFATPQMADASRGLSFQHDGPLDMRLDPTANRRAGDLIAELPERELADLIYRFGEERLSRQIARKIVETRRQRPIRSTRQLADLCVSVYAGRVKGRWRIHPATRTFQALRIAVNDELGRLDRLLEQLGGLIKPGGRAAIISFHSLEDRPVKQAFVQLARDGRAERLTRKPLTATDDEQQANPASRSAKLRAIRWIGPGT